MKSTYWKFWVICAAAAGLMIGPTGCQSGKLSFPKLSSWAPTPPKWLTGKKGEDDAPPPSMHFNQEEMQANQSSSSGSLDSRTAKSNTALPSSSERPSDFNSPKSSKLAASPTTGGNQSANSSTTPSTANGNPAPFRLSQPTEGFTQPGVANAGPSGATAGLDTSGAPGNRLANNNPANQPSRTPYQYQGSTGAPGTNAPSLGAMANNSLENTAKSLADTLNQSKQAMKNQVSSATEETKRVLGESATQFKNDLTQKIDSTVQGTGQKLTEKINQASNTISNMNPLGGSGDFLPMGKVAQSSATPSGGNGGQFGGFSNPTGNTSLGSVPSGTAANSSSPTMGAGGGFANNPLAPNANPSTANPLVPNQTNNGNAFALTPQNVNPSVPSAQPNANPNPMGFNGGSVAQSAPPTNAFPAFPPTSSQPGSTPLASNPSPTTSPGFAGQTAGQFQGAPMGSPAVPSGQNLGNSGGGGFSNNASAIGSSFPMNAGNMVQSASPSGPSASTNQPASFTAELPPELLNRSGNYTPGSTGQFK